VEIVMLVSKIMAWLGGLAGIFLNTSEDFSINGGIHMSKENGKIRVGLYIEQDLLRICDKNLKTGNARSRNELVNDALRFYLGYLTSQKSEDYLLKSMSSVLTSTVQDTENRIARVIFKLAVETSMAMNVIAAHAQIDNATLSKLRGKCVDDVRRSSGSIQFENIYKYQKRL